MSQWGVAAFMSRVAERVSTAGEGFAAQLKRRRSGSEVRPNLDALDDAFPFVEPSPEFVESLRRQLLEAAVLVPPDVVAASSMATRRVVYGIAAVCSVLSAGVIALLLVRARCAAQRPAV